MTNFSLFEHLARRIMFKILSKYSNAMQIYKFEQKMLSNLNEINSKIPRLNHFDFSETKCC